MFEKFAFIYQFKKKLNVKFRTLNFKILMLQFCREISKQKIILFFEIFFGKICFYLSILKTLKSFRNFNGAVLSRNF